MVVGFVKIFIIWVVLVLSILMDFVLQEYQEFIKIMILIWVSILLPIYYNINLGRSN